ncbi:NitT/TauT family transport system ATP-binding protein [Clostridium collagenovorans DSM 3089]|uniref:NitT/TauT family transport system ATP-binding protein n=1 Tax=Clostridium collagenovorans DSM 3089 TaxID=1121306 RepID=A0A1M5XAH9_9CLOT|nr:ABC transporter ATP-binding protein SaoA [Clostridium collagenovorans]SHH96548.1 NitT/TauT family transport system ATP-binding protein [Clostridium collagenovorans DSM 3089]
MKIKIDNISKSFKNNKEINEVLKDISFEVNEGEFVSLLGPSGCGKTTLLTIIAGFKGANLGEISVGDKIVRGPGADRGFVFQNYALFPWMTVEKNILYPMKQQKVPKEDRRARLNQLLKMSKLEGKEKLYPSQLSGGMKQRIAVIRALACKPEVLLLDEPLGAVDFQMRKILQEELESIFMADKTTAIMVTHDVDEAVYMSDRVIVMSTDKGRIIEDLKIDLPRPRVRDCEQYNSYKDKLTEVLTVALGYEEVAVSSK